VIAEHDYIVEMPEGLEIENITDFVRGWFKAEVQILICKDCGERSVGWRHVRSDKRQSGEQK